MENDRVITAPDAAIRHHCDRPSPYCSGYKILQHNLASHFIHAANQVLN